VVGLPEAVEGPGDGVDLVRFAMELDLRPEQTEAWSAFLATWRRAEHDCRKMDSIARERLGERAPALPDALHLEAQKLTVRLDSARRLETAARLLFASLSEKQKAKAGPLLARVCLDAVATNSPVLTVDGSRFDPLIEVPRQGDLPPSRGSLARHRQRARTAGWTGSVATRSKRGDLQNG
jgi:hypothetical protein